MRRLLTVFFFLIKNSHWNNDNNNNSSSNKLNAIEEAIANKLKSYYIIVLIIGKDCLFVGVLAVQMNDSYINSNVATNDQVAVEQNRTKPRNKKKNNYTFKSTCCEIGLQCLRWHAAAVIAPMFQVSWAVLGDVIDVCAHKKRPWYIRDFVETWWFETVQSK